MKAIEPRGHERNLHERNQIFYRQSIHCSGKYVSKNVNRALILLLFGLEFVGNEFCSFRHLIDELSIDTENDQRFVDSVI